MSRSVKAIVQLSNNMINHAKFLMMMHVCEEQLSLFLVLLQLAHRNYIICSTNYFQKNLWPLIGKCFISIFKCTLQNSENLVTFFHTDWTIMCHRVNVMSNNQLGHQEQSQFSGDINTLWPPQHSTSLQKLEMRDCIIQEKDIWPPIASFPVSVYCSFA